MIMYKIISTDLFREDVRLNRDYIRDELQNPIAALSFLKELKKKSEYLKEMPNANPLIKDTLLASLGYRLIKVKEYLLFYCVNEPEKKVILERLLYSHRDYNSILKYKK